MARISHLDPTRIVILGGGFGGVYTALHLQRLWASNPAVQIILVSRSNYFLMTPLLFEAGSGVLEPRHAVTPIRRLLDKVRFVEAEIDRVDFDGRMVHAHHTTQPSVIYDIPYDHLVIALGGVTNTRLVPGSENGLGFKTLADAIYLRNHIIDLFEQADVERDPARKAQLLTFVVIGAGLVGVELMGEMTEFIENLHSAYPHVEPREVTFHLIEGGPRILGETEADLAEYAADVLRRRGVHVRVNTRVSRVDPDGLQLPDGQTIPAQTIIVATGVAPSPLCATMDLAKDRKGRILTDPTMRSTSHPNVWALGDCAAIPDPSGKPYPPLAQHALRQAKVLARNITATIRGGAVQPFKYKSLGTLASLGHYSGVGRVLRMKIRGFLAWWVWRTYYLFQMPRFDRRLRIMLDWTIALLFRNDVVKLDLFGQRHPGRAEAPAPIEEVV